MMFANFWHSYAESLGWQPTAEQIEQFELLYRLILAGNQRQNLTRITNPTDFWEKHLWDSLCPVVPFFPLSDQQVIDLGTGAGFPGLPLAIACPHWQIALLDSRRKKTDFIQSAITQLGLTNAKTITARAEKFEGSYDLVTIRAVGSVEQCWSYAQPLLIKNGTAILYRGHLTPEEISAVKNNIKQMYGWLTPVSQSQRNCLYLQHSLPLTLNSFS